MNIPYRTRRLLMRIGIAVLVAVFVAAVVWLCWFVWLGRYVVYTRDDGAVLDFDRSPELAAGQLAQPPEPSETIPIYYNEGENLVNNSSELTQLLGYYVEPAALQEDISAVMTQIRALPAETAVMVDVKNIKGEFYYSSTVGSLRSSSVDTTAMDELIQFLDRSNMYTIARLPALRDYHFGLNNVPSGLFHSSRQYLWMDDDSCYWLNPTSEGTFSYLVQIVNELKALGFDEVVFSDFRFPDTTQIYFDGDKSQALADTAKKLLSACASDRFAVSFVSTTGFTLPEGRCRLYLQNVAAADLTSVAADTGIDDTAVNLVFLTEVHDTRFDVYGVLRPLSTAH